MAKLTPASTEKIMLAEVRRQKWIHDEISDAQYAQDVGDDLDWLIARVKELEAQLLR